MLPHLANLLLKDNIRLSIIILFLILLNENLYSKIEPPDSSFWIRSNWSFIPYDSIFRNDNHYRMQGITQIAFKDSLCGMVFTNDGFYLPIVYRTTNGGNTWHEIFRELGQLEDDTTEYFFPSYLWKSEINNEQVILSMRYQPGDWHSSDTTYIYRSTDFGDTFKKIDIDSEMGFYDLDMLNEKYGAILARKEFLTTNDSGKSWQKSKPFDNNIKYPQYIQVISENKIFLYDVFYNAPGSNKDRIFFTENNGETWDEIIPPAHQVYRVHFFNEWEGLILGYDSVGFGYGNRLVLRHTTDRGKSWRLLWYEQRPYKDYSSIMRVLKFYNRYNGIMAGDNGLIYQTTDGGYNWNYIGTEGKRPEGKSPIYFKSLDFCSKEKLFASGVLGSEFDLLKIILETPVKVDDDNKKQINSEIYPNPATDFITIQTQPSEGLKPSEGSDVEIFDMLGVKMQTTPHTLTSLSNRGGSLRIDVSHLPVGLYFIKIDNRVEKFVKM